ncbi:hypothetical protein [Pseudomonas pohangensis]|jgi:hypothetical protein|nr:hypothetical protein [Pseudomonas pohangensis]
MLALQCKKIKIINVAFAITAQRNRSGTKMKRKPDLLWVLVILFGLGVVTTGYTQTLWERQTATEQVGVLHAY